MKSRVLGYVAALMVGFGTGSFMSNGVSANTGVIGPVAVSQGTDAAFRDGLYMGKHDAEEGRLRHIAAGRWSGSADRSEYQSGYDAGFATAAAR